VKLNCRRTAGGENCLLRYRSQLGNIPGAGASRRHRGVEYNNLQLGGGGMDLAVARRILGRCIYWQVLDDRGVTRHLPSGMILRPPPNAVLANNPQQQTKCHQ
jgi:hypothetical protein